MVVALDPEHEDRTKDDLAKAAPDYNTDKKKAKRKGRSKGTGARGVVKKITKEKFAGPGIKLREICISNDDVQRMLEERLTNRSQESSGHGTGLTQEQALGIERKRQEALRRKRRKAESASSQAPRVSTGDAIEDGIRLRIELNRKRALERRSRRKAVEALENAFQEMDRAVERPVGGWPYGPRV